MKYRTLAYYGTCNLGDAIQAIAISRLLPGDLIGVRRDKTHESNDATNPFVVNGYLWSHPDSVVPSDTNCLFSGIYVSPNSLAIYEWIKKSRYAVSARDPITQSKLKSQGIDAVTVGCATMTFPKYNGVRSGVVKIGYDTSFSQKIPDNVSWEDQWKMALERLDLCRRADTVITDRLHIALPSLAMGCKVVVEKNSRRSVMEAERLSILDWLGFEYDTPFQVDLSGPAANYKKWLGEQLQAPIIEHDPVFPPI